MSSALPPSEFFPPAELADPWDSVGMGGKLTPEWLLDAYRHGIFPWPSTGTPLEWYSPDPRGIIEFDAFHISRSLARTLRSGRFEVTFDHDFAGVIRGCATSSGRRRGTWLTPAMQAAYIKMHELGYAHSVETWHNGELAGGTYGVALSGMFSAESMFFRVRDASKVALAHLVGHLRDRGYQLLDIQQLTPHTASLGATAISREEFLERLARALKSDVTFVRKDEG
jgi:leucyl/phenylalanyl-tRNA--protein transferase